MVIGADGRKRSHTFHRVMMRSAAKLSYQQTQFAIGGRTDEDTETLVEPVLSRSMRLTKRSSARAPNADRSISICRSGKSCSKPTAPSTA